MTLISEVPLLLAGASRYGQPCSRLWRCALLGYDSNQRQALQNSGERDACSELAIESRRARVEWYERVARGDDESPLGLIGGIRLWSVRVPFPAAGRPVARYSFRPLNDFPESYRKGWYYTSQSRRERWCAGETP